MTVIESIKNLKYEKNAVILAHYYQPLAVQDIADHVGDSFALARIAQDTESDVIVVCGVRFMAESAKILNPTRTVYLPAPDAGCPMADMITPFDVLELRDKYPDAAVVCYVNSSADVKAVSDVCCTSSSAVRIVKGLSQKRVIFVPDQNLGAYVAEQVPDKEIILFAGYCPTHHRVLERDIIAAKAAHPKAEVLVHPECRPEVLKHADFIGSTAEILNVARKSTSEQTLIGTEESIVEILSREFPERKFYLIKAGFTCPNMKKTSLKDVERALLGDEPPIELPLETIRGALRSLERMTRS